MQKTTGHVLKSNEVKLEGRLQLPDISGLTSPRVNQTKNGGSALPAQQVRIVDNNPQYAMIEITCSCGMKTYLKCEYGAAEAHAPQ